jgi:hypothetical protein
VSTLLHGDHDAACITELRTESRVADATSIPDYDSCNTFFALSADLMLIAEVLDIFMLQAGLALRSDTLLLYDLQFVSYHHIENLGLLTSSLTFHSDRSEGHSERTASLKPDPSSSSPPSKHR